MVETFLSSPGAESGRQGLVHTRQVSYHWAPAGREPAAWSLVWGSSVTWHPSLEPSTLRTFLFTAVQCLCRGSPSHFGTYCASKHLHFQRSTKIPSESGSLKVLFYQSPIPGFWACFISVAQMLNSRLWSVERMNSSLHRSKNPRL